MKKSSTELLLGWLKELSEESFVTINNDVDNTSFADGMKFGIDLIQHRLKFYINLYNDNVEFEEKLAKMRDHNRRTK